MMQECWITALLAFTSQLLNTTLLQTRWDSLNEKQYELKIKLVTVKTYKIS